MLNSGEFRYQASGLMDRTHLRWFTRTTIADMFQRAGFEITDGRSRIFPDSASERILPLIRAFAVGTGATPQQADQAVQDAIPLQYVVRAVPR